MVSAMQKTKSLIAPLVQTAAALGIVQGLGWTLLSLAAIILFYLTDIEISENTISKHIYNIYLNKTYDGDTEDGYIIGPSEFSYFMYLYLILSFSWLVVSSVLLWGSIRGKTAYYNNSLVSWTVIAALLSLLDLILLFLLSHDYWKLNSNNIAGAGTLFLVANGIVMTMAARGFVLWIINVVFAVILGKHWYRRYTESVAGKQPAIDAYATGLRPPLWERGSSTFDDQTPSEFDNRAYMGDNDSSMFSPSSQHYQEPEDRNYRNNNKNRERNNDNGRGLTPVNLSKPNNYDDNYWNNKPQNRGGNGPLSRGTYMEPDSVSPYGQPAPLRTAKIGRQGGQRSPPLNVASPYIPDPDYSPPGSPKVRGVLRPNSNYIMY